MKNILQWEIPKWFTRIINIILLWYMIPLCTGIVEGLIRNDLNGTLLSLSFLFFPLLAWAFLGYNLASISSCCLGETPELLGMFWLIAAVVLHLCAFIFSILFCIKGGNIYWIMVSLFVFFASLRMCEILSGMLGV